MAAGQTLLSSGGIWELPAQTPVPYRAESERGWMPTSAWGKLGQHYCWVLKFKKKLRSCVIVKNKGGNDSFASRSLQK